jgi:hypothetical protein
MVPIRLSIVRLNLAPLSVLVKNLCKLGITTAIRQINFGVAFTNLVDRNLSFQQQSSFSNGKALGWTSRRLDPLEDCTLPQEFSIGLVSAIVVELKYTCSYCSLSQTNLVSPTIEVCWKDFFFGVFQNLILTGNSQASWQANSQK